MCKDARDCRVIVICMLSNLLDPIYSACACCRLRMLGMLPKYDLTVLTFDDMTASMIERDYSKVGVRHLTAPLLSNKSTTMTDASSTPSNHNALSLTNAFAKKTPMKEGADLGKASNFGAKDWFVAHGHHCTHLKTHAHTHPDEVA